MAILLIIVGFLGVVFSKTFITLFLFLLIGLMGVYLFAQFAREDNGFVKKDFVLEDVISGLQAPIKCSIEISDQICFIAEGYGDYCSQGGQGCSVMIENHEGILQVIIWDDINSEDYKIISLANARESQRK